MSAIDWNEIWNTVISKSILKVASVIASGILGGFVGLLKGKKVAVNAIERKNDIYQPLIDELEKYSGFNWSVREKVNAPFLQEVVNNSYKYGINNEIQNKCNDLLENINLYNNIDPIKIAHSIITSIFEKGYTEIYGSIIEGKINQSDRYGNEWEEEIIAEPVQTIRQSNYSDEIENLLLNEGMYSDEVCIDKERLLYEPIYLQLKRIYQLSLNVIINGKKYKNPNPIIELEMLPEEYMALNYDFFEIYNNDERIKKKYELQEDIIYTSQSIIQSLKEIICQIVQKYEVEEI